MRVESGGLARPLSFSCPLRHAFSSLCIPASAAASRMSCEIFAEQSFGQPLKWHLECREVAPV
jgi:hypothetical protein